LGPIDAFWHLTNFFGPALGLGLITPLFAKLLWRRALQSVAWARLAAWATLACAAVAVAGLVVFGHDGKMATYAAMVGVCALTLWWFGFGAKSR
jgi:hypothetical protein